MYTSYQTRVIDTKNCHYIIKNNFYVLLQQNYKGLQSFIELHVRFKIVQFKLLLDQSGMRYTCIPIIEFYIFNCGFFFKRNLRIYASWTINQNSRILPFLKNNNDIVNQIKDQRTSFLIRLATLYKCMVTK